MIKSLFFKILYQPLFNVLALSYAYFNDLGIAIIILTVLVRLVLFPIFYKGAKDQAILSRLAPRIKELQTKHKDEPTKQMKATMDLYREHKVNPLSQFLLLLIQLPVLIALFQIFSRGIKENPDGVLYSFVKLTGPIHSYSLGFIDLNNPSFVLALITGVIQYFFSKMSMPKIDNSKEMTMAEKMGKQMIFIAPVLTIIVLSPLPSAVGFYWLTSLVFSVIQQMVINNRLKDKNYGTIGANKTNSPATH